MTQSAASTCSRRHLSSELVVAAIQRVAVLIDQSTPPAAFRSGHSIELPARYLKDKHRGRANRQQKPAQSGMEYKLHKYEDGR